MLWTVVSMRVGGLGEQHLVVGRNVSLRLDCQRVIHLIKKKKKKTAAEEEGDLEEEEEGD